MASDVHSIVGRTTLQNLSTYDVRTVTKGKAADNKSYVSSQTKGGTFRVSGNLDATWEISLYGRDADKTELHNDLQPGKTISVQINGETQLYTMMIESSSLEVDIESGELVGISLSCSAFEAGSYKSGESPNP